MRSDIDRLMAERELGAIIAAGGEQQNTIRAYLSNGVDIHGGITIKKHGSAPVLLVSAMEIEEAAHSGLQVVTYDDLGGMGVESYGKQKQKDRCGAHEQSILAVRQSEAQPPALRGGRVCSAAGVRSSPAADGLPG